MAGRVGERTYRIGRPLFSPWNLWVAAWGTACIVNTKHLVHLATGSLQRRLPAACSTTAARADTHGFIRRRLTPPQSTRERWLGTIARVGR